MKAHLTALLIIPAISIPGFASTPTMYVLTKPCTISIHKVKHTGEQQALRFTSRFRNLSECRQLADLHRPNFENDLLKSKSVRYDWNFEPLKKSKVVPKPKKTPKFIRGYSKTTIKRMKPILATFRRR